MRIVPSAGTVPFARAVVFWELPRDASGTKQISTERQPKENPSNPFNPLDPNEPSVRLAGRGGEHN
jgi:hypothetical protein